MNLDDDIWNGASLNHAEPQNYDLWAEQRVSGYKSDWVQTMLGILGVITLIALIFAKMTAKKKQELYWNAEKKDWMPVPETKTDKPATKKKTAAKSKKCTTSEIDALKSRIDALEKTVGWLKGIVTVHVCG